jgi:hypothetical protein
LPLRALLRSRSIEAKTNKQTNHKGWRKAKGNDKEKKRRVEKNLGGALTVPAKLGIVFRKSNSLESQFL